MANKLAHENSPYLLQHANNPVDWYPWGPEALEKARSEDKPIFLSIGYAACHWCHVMAHESFEDAEIASILNQNFISIKVDREERPDLDNIYMQSVVAMTGQGGWPLSVFLTPDGNPFFGGTYFPPVQRGNLPSFRHVLHTVTRLWNEDRSQLLSSGDQIRYHLMQTNKQKTINVQMSEETLNNAAMNLAKEYDWKFGGWGKAPKFPQPMSIEFLLRKATRGDLLARDIASHALESMAKGGMYDVIGGGFSRYSTDDRWFVPHFEKMLYDNAQLALVYLHGWLVTRNPLFRRVCEDTLDFIIREMSHPMGGFYSSLDADSEGKEGDYYLWTYDEIKAELKDNDDLLFFTTAYDINESGNFEGKILLQLAIKEEQLADRFSLSVLEVTTRLVRLNNKLLDARSKRIKPSIDDKIIVSWNSLTLIAFAEAGRYLNHENYIAIAERNARFILDNLLINGRLFHSWRINQGKYNAYLDDYAALIVGLLSLYQSDANPEWFITAKKLADTITDHFSDPDSGFFDTSDDHESLILRPKNIQDNATPSGNALAVYALLQLSAFEGHTDWRNTAETMLSKIQGTAQQYPTAFGLWLQATDFAIGPTYEIALIVEPNAQPALKMYQALWNKYRPRFIMALSSFPPPPGAPQLLKDRPIVNDLPTAYICKDFVCLQPTNNLNDIDRILDNLI